MHLNRKYFSEDYKIARSKCRTAIDTSDLNSDLDSRRPHRKPARFISSDSEDSEGNNEPETVPKIPSVSLVKGIIFANKIFIQY